MGRQSVPSRDLFHDAVKNALVKDGWKITHDPLPLAWGTRDLYVHLGAEQVLAAERNGTKIAVEIKSFTGPSEVTELERALGQYVLYGHILRQVEPGRILYLAIPKTAFSALLDGAAGAALVENERLHLIVFDPQTEIILQWIP